MSTEPRRIPRSVHASPASMAALAAESLTLYDVVMAYRQGGWNGEAENRRRVGETVAVGEGGDDVSCFPLASGEKLWVATDTIRNVTAVFLASERY